jgi:hypothetical protein
MKEPKSKSHSDGMCVYVQTEVNNSVASKLLIIVADTLILSVLILSIVEWIPGLFICTLIFLAFLTWTTLWAFWGKENLIINTKSLSYQHDYGFFKTRYTVKSIHARLIVISQKTDDEVRCSFVSYQESNDLPLEIYSMTLPISEKECERINTLIEELYVDRLSDDYEFPYINLN